MSGGDTFCQTVQQVTIVGTGLLGTSLGLGLRAAGFTGTIIGVGRRNSTVDRAKRLGCFDQGTTDLGPAVAGSQLVVLATPLGTFSQLLERLAPNEHPQMVITDVGSTKQSVCHQAQRILNEPARFVGSHPMAGGERHGPEFARPDLFAGKPCVVTPAPQTNPDALRLVWNLWDTLGMNLIEMTSAEHDQKAARISHLPHVAAVLLVSLAERSGAMQIASTGFRDTTRIASGEPTVWRDIFSANREDLLEVIDEFAQDLTVFRQRLARHEDVELLKWHQRAKQARDNWLQRSDETSDQSQSI